MSKQLLITHYIYDDVMTLSHYEREQIYDYANCLSLSVIGNLRKAHIILYDHIMDALSQKYNVRLEGVKEHYYYVRTAPIENEFEIYKAWSNNLIDTFGRACGWDNIWRGKDLEILYKNSHLLNDEVYHTFDSADANVGDAVIYNGKHYICIKHGILKYFENYTDIHALVRRELLPNGVDSSDDEIREVVMHKERYTCEIIKSKTIVE